jgi:uncharacterized RDD family membrane protein YckC
VTTPPTDPPPPGQYGQPPYYGGQPSYGAPPGQYGQPPYGAPPGQYGQPGYGAPAAGYGPAPYGGARLAPWIERVGEYLIDSIIIAVPSGLIGLLTGSRAVYDLLAFIGFLVMGYLNGAQGQTPGKRVLSIKILREQDGQLLGGGMGVVRQLCHLLDSLACLIGWLWPLWDSKRQTFADKLVSTVAIKV